MWKFKNQSLKIYFDPLLCFLLEVCCHTLYVSCFLASVQPCKITLLWCYIYCTFHVEVKVALVLRGAFEGLTQAKQKAFMILFCHKAVLCLGESSVVVSLTQCCPLVSCPCFCIWWRVRSQSEQYSDFPVGLIKAWPLPTQTHNTAANVCLVLWVAD